MYKCIDTIRTPKTKGKDIHQTFIQQNVQKYNFMSLNILSSPKFCPIDTRKFFLRCIIHMYYHHGIVLIDLLLSSLHVLPYSYSKYCNPLGNISIWRDPSTHSCIDWGSNFSPFLRMIFLVSIVSSIYLHC